MSCNSKLSTNKISPENKSVSKTLEKVLYDNELIKEVKVCSVYINLRTYN